MLTLIPFGMHNALHYSKHVTYAHRSSPITELFWVERPWLFCHIMQLDLLIFFGGMICTKIKTNFAAVFILMNCFQGQLLDCGKS